MGVSNFMVISDCQQTKVINFLSKNHKRRSEMAQSSNDVKKIFKLFQNFAKLSGTSCFCYPRDTFKNSTIGICIAAFHSISCLFLFIRTVQSLTVKSKSELSVVYLFGLKLISLQIILVVLAAACLSFLLRKNMFQTLKMFEKFDEVIFINLKFYLSNQMLTDFCFSKTWI